MTGNADLTAVIDGDSKQLTDALKEATSALQDFEQGAGAMRYRDGGIVIPAGASAGGNVFNVHIQTPNPESFGQSHGQISALLAQAVQREQRNL